MPAVVVILLVLAAALYAGSTETVRLVLGQWADPYSSLSHGYLLLATACWFALQSLRASASPALALQPSWGMLPLLVVFAAIAALADLLFIGDARTLFLPLLLGAATALVLGPAATRRLVLPLAFLFLGLPVWSSLTAPLQSLTTAAAEMLVAVAGIPAYVEGNFVHLPEGTFEIAAGCAGTNYLLASLTLAAAACARLVDGWKRRLVLMLMAAATALVANWIRVASLIVIGHVTHMQHYLVRVDHLSYGWLVFAVAMLPLFLLAYRWRGIEAGTTALPAIATPAMPVFPQVAALLVACVVLLAPAMLRPEAPSQAVQPAPLVRFPSGWQPRTDSPAPRAYLLNAGSAPAEPVELFVAHYPGQSATSRLSNPGNDLAAGPWRVVGSDVVQEPGLEQRVMSMLLAADDGDHLLYAWYVAAGNRAHSKLTLRFAELQGLLEGRRDGLAIALLTRCAPDCGAAGRRLAMLVPELDVLRSRAPDDALLSSLGFGPS